MQKRWTNCHQILAFATLFSMMTLSNDHAACQQAADTAESTARRATIERIVDEQTRAGPDGAVITVWIGFSDGRELYTRDIERTMPVASAIKTAILVELFARYEGALEQAPAESTEILADSHAALRHYSESERRAVRDALGQATVDHIGRVMIGSAAASNKVYNGAANLAIGLLGGPEEATHLIRARDPDFSGLTLNRYMLANREERGDNTATAVSLAAVHRRLAERDLAGLSPKTIDRARDVLADTTSDLPLFSKGGSLPTDPLARIRAGWWEGPKQRLVCVVMGTAPKPIVASADSDTAYNQLDTCVKVIWDQIRQTYLDELSPS